MRARPEIKRTGLRNHEWEREWESSSPMDPDNSYKFLTQKPTGGGVAQTEIQLQAQIMRRWDRQKQRAGWWMSLPASPPCAHDSNMRSTVRTGLSPWQQVWQKRGDGGQQTRVRSKGSIQGSREQERGTSWWASSWPFCHQTWDGKRLLSNPIFGGKG